MAQVNDKIKGLIEVLVTNSTVGENGVVSPNEGAFAATLPEGLSVETVRQVQEHTKDVHVAWVGAVGEQAATAFTTHGELKQVLGDLQMGHDTSSVEIDRTKTIPAGIGKDAGTKDVIGYVSKSTFTTSSGAKSSQYKAVRESVQERIQAALAE